MIARVAFTIVWALAALLLARPADAVVVTTQSGAHVLISNASESATYTFCGIWFMTNVQRMTIEGGPSMLLPVDHVYKPGRYDLTLLSSCDGYNIYGVGPCGCSAQPSSCPSATPLSSLLLTSFARISDKGCFGCVIGQRPIELKNRYINL